MKTLFYVFAGMRPRQWTKNLVVFAGLVFSQSIANPQLLLKSVDEAALLAAARLGLDACGRLSRGVQSTLDAAPVSML